LSHFVRSEYPFSRRKESLSYSGNVVFCKESEHLVPHLGDPPSGLILRLSLVASLTEFLKIYFNIVIPYTFVYPNWSIFFRLFNQYFL
jgi:hypothetical protein